MPELVDLVKRKIRIINSKVITRAGRFIGFVKEYSIDDHTGEIVGLELKSDADIPSPDHNVIPAENIVTIGKDIIIVEDDVETALRADHGSAAVGGVARSAPPKPAPKPAYSPPPARPAAPPAPRPATAVVEEPAGIDAESDVDIEELLDLDTEAETSGNVQESAGTADFDDRGLAAENGKESLSEIFERRQIKYMLGKRVSKDVYSEDGRLIISQAETITDTVIKLAKASGKFLELSMNIEIEE
jgi:sporulation protein YlmC with PRC-barrel domain